MKEEKKKKSCAQLFTRKSELHTHMYAYIM